MSSIAEESSFDSGIEPGASPLRAPESLRADHPVHSYLSTNRNVLRQAVLGAQRAGELLRSRSEPERERLQRQIGELLAELDVVEEHYLHLEKEVYPLLTKHVSTALPVGMQGMQNRVRGRLQRARRASVSGDRGEINEAVTAVVRGMVELAYQENNVLLPMCLQVFTEAEWDGIRDRLAGMVIPSW